jgi:hypothetical protein
MKKSLASIIFCLILAASLAGCALGTPAQPSPAPATSAPAAAPTKAPTTPPQPTAVPTAVPEPTSAETAAASSALDEAKKTAQEYAAALQSGDFAAASKQLSSFSLTSAQMTAGDAADALAALKSKGAAWSNFQVGDAQEFSPKTVLVHVTYDLAGKDSKSGEVTKTAMDEFWPVRFDMDGWHYNWNNLIDFKTLDVQERLVSGNTVKPLALSRYSDRIVLTLLVQNASSEAVVWGLSPSETVSTFYFGDKVIEGEKERVIFDTLRSYPDTHVTVKGLFTSFSDKVELRKFKNTTTAPWFTFLLTE